MTESCSQPAPTEVLTGVGCRRENRVPGWQSPDLPFPAVQARARDLGHNPVGWILIELRHD